jgi:hypothetical protein
MEEDHEDIKGEPVDAALGDMKLEEGGGSSVEGTTIVSGTYDERNTPVELRKSRSSTPATKHSASQSPVKMECEKVSTALSDDEMEEVDGDENTVSVEPEKISKTSRKSAPKVVSRPPILYNDLEDMVEEAVTKFDLLQQCRYGSKKLGASNSDPWDCDCPEEWSRYSPS